MGTNVSPSAGDGSEGPVADSEGHGDEDKREFPSDGALMPCMSSSDEGESGVEIRGSQWNLEGRKKKRRVVRNMVQLHKPNYPWDSQHLNSASSIAVHLNSLFPLPLS
ncbi:hypothetical protein Q3G72_013135 [Acer saccharum]|nr:hypothetical protein Q3G72_013135 [Acer saccharum]